MVDTTRFGCLPTLVSPESITASAPSRIALATSEASARLGREFSIIDSSICVATITGLPASRHIWIAPFCTIGTSSRGSSTPRSPRATMTPSKASTMPSRFATACGFSTLARTGIRRPISSMIACTSSTSAAERTNDRNTKSTPMRNAQRRSSLSLSDSAGTLTATPGRLMPLLLLTGPPSITRVRTRGPSTSITSSLTLPSSTSTVSPGIAVTGQALVGGAALGHVTEDVLGGDRELRAVARA